MEIIPKERILIEGDSQSQILNTRSMFLKKRLEKGHFISTVELHWVYEGPERDFELNEFIRGSHSTILSPVKEDDCGEILEDNKMFLLMHFLFLFLFSFWNKHTL